LLSLVERKEMTGATGSTKDAVIRAADTLVINLALLILLGKEASTSEKLRNQLLEAMASSLDEYTDARNLLRSEEDALADAPLVD
jgi:hypothetical protein